MQIVRTNTVVDKAEMEAICREAIERLRKNQGCDIEFGAFTSKASFAYSDPAVPWFMLAMKVHGEHMALNLVSDCFSYDMPKDEDEDKVYMSSNGNKKAMIVLRIAKIIFDNYKGWLKQKGLGAKAAKLSPIEPAGSTPTVPMPSPSIGKLVIGGKEVALNDTYARSTISSVTSVVDDMKDKLDYSEQEVVRLKEILSDTRDEKAQLEKEVSDLKNQLNVVMQVLADKGVI